VGGDEAAPGQPGEAEGVVLVETRHPLDPEVLHEEHGRWRAEGGIRREEPPGRKGLPMGGEGWPRARRRL